MSHNFVSQLPIIPITDLKYGTKCTICGEDYGTTIPASDILPEDPVRLPCNHEFGHVCLTTWLSPTQESKNTCPLCRRTLFPFITPSAEAEAESAALVPSPSPHDQIINWDTMPSTVDSQLSASGIVHRSPPFRDWLLYTQLRGQGADLPAWRPSSSSSSPGPRLDAEQEEALFGELRRRGAFRLLPVAVGPLVSDREVWGFLRGRGYSYDAVHAATANECAWLRV